MITVAKVLKHEPCYTKERLQKLIGDGITFSQMVSLKIPRADKAWVLEHITPRIKKEKISSEFLWGCSCQDCFYVNIKYASAKQLRKIAEILDGVKSTNKKSR